jgi:uncharacterized protein involved in outer membrane biogenesis
MPRLWKTITLSCAIAVAVLGAVAAWWLPSNEALAQRAAQLASERAGVDVTVGALQWHVLPRPRVVLREVATAQQRPLRLEQLTLQPQLLPLLSGKLVFDRVALHGGTLAQRSLRELGRSAKASSDTAHQADAAAITAVEVARVEIRDLTWISRSGVAVVYEGEADIDAGLRLRTATLRRPGVLPAADLTVTRESDAQDAAEQRFALRARLGGGTAEGQAQLTQAADGSWRLQGTLTPRGVEIQAALKAFNRNSPVSGQADGETTLAASGPHALALVQSLHTQTRFVMAPATVLRFDLDRAITTLGREHQGQTALACLRGRVETQNSPDGTIFRFLSVQARAGRFSATGEARLQDRRLQARAAVDLVDGVVGVPVTIEGPLGGLKVTVSKAPLVGAAVGTAILPGVGTAIGAAIGRVLGGPSKPAPPAARPPAPCAL